MTAPKGFYVDGKEWNLAPSPRYTENPPDTWEDCEQCGGTHPPSYTGDCRSDINRWPSEKCIAALTIPALTKRLSWRTKQDQFFQSAECGQTHIIKFIGTCENCGRSVYSHGCVGAKPCGDLVTDSPDPRGAIPAQHCLNFYHAREYNMTGRDLVTCASCADDGDKYRSIMAAAKTTGTWKPVSKEQNNCDGSGPHSLGEVRLMPTGGDGNLILCLRCWMRENSYRIERNRELGDFAKFSIVEWQNAIVYKVGE